MNAIDLRNLIRPLVEPTVERLGYDLVAVEWVGGQRGPILRISVDRLGGINADDCASVSAHISPLLDQADPIRARYTLEVSSPGMDRPVQRAVDFERFKSYTLQIRLVEGHPRRRYKGVLDSVDEDEITVVVDGQAHTLRLDTIERANLILNLSEYETLAEDSR